MKRKKILPLAIVIGILFTAWLVYGRDQQTRSTAQSWEYRRISIGRPAEPNANGDFTSWFDGEVTLPLPVNMTKKLNELGGQGWELVSVVSISNSFSERGDYAGYTNQINYFLKRPK